MATDAGGSGLPLRTTLPPPIEGVPYLQDFNLIASQRGKRVSWMYSSTGLAHALRWQAVCIGDWIFLVEYGNSSLKICQVDGECKGLGEGKDKTEARDTAARNSYSLLNWGEEQGKPYALPP